MSRLRSKEQLQAAAEHLDYEYQMLVAVARALASGTQPGWLTNALLESFVIHLRALIDFLYPPERTTPDDMLSTDYFYDAAVWERARPPMSPELRRARTRAHKEIAHLTYTRLEVTPETKPWQFLDILSEIESLMSLFRQTAAGQSS